MPGRSILRDVAQAAGVSLRTASRVLNEDPRVAEATRSRVLAVMAELDYRPDSMAQSLRNGRDSTIGLVVESIADPFFAELVEAVEAAAGSAGRSVLVASTHRDPERERAAVTGMLSRRVAGLLLAPTASDHGWLGEAHVPVVLVDRPAPGLRGDLVRIDDHEATVRGVGHLLAHGHRDIGYVGDSPDVATSADRLSGYRDALLGHGLCLREDLVRADAATSRDAHAATRALMDSAHPPTALLSAATRCSLGVVPALHELGRTDVALVGFGDFAMADSLTPAVTVLDHSARDIGREAVARLERRIADPGLPAETLYAPVRLVRRGSGELEP